MIEYINVLHPYYKNYTCLYFRFIENFFVKVHKVFSSDVPHRKSRSPTYLWRNVVRYFFLDESLHLFLIGISSASNNFFCFFFFGYAVDVSSCKNEVYTGNHVMNICYSPSFDITEGKSKRLSSSVTSFCRFSVWILYPLIILY